MPLLADVAAYLAAAGHGTVGEDIFTGSMPDKPDACIALYELEGERPEYNWDAERPTLTVRVRAATRADAQSKAAEVWGELWNLTGVAMSGVQYHRVEGRGSVAQAGVDGRGRCYYIANFAVIKEVE